MASASALYHRSPVEPPFGRGTLWVHHGQRARLDLLAQIEAASVTLPTPLSTYAIDQVSRAGLDAITGCDIEQRLTLLHQHAVPMQDALPRLRDGLREKGEREAERGAVWVVLRAFGAPWALIYMGDEPLHAHRVAD
ncbi:MAG: hypothetical protein ACYCUM_13680 [Solirubrobacteraceae bacterium]